MNNTQTVSHNLTHEHLMQLTQNNHTPYYVYDEQILKQSIHKITSMPHAYGLTVRYAMKANPTRAILEIIHQHWLHIDASSGYEAQRALAAGIPWNHIQLVGQEFPHNSESLINQWVKFVACSLHQLEAYGQLFPGTTIGIRANPWLSGWWHNNRTSVGWPTAWFGIWHERLGQAQQIADQHNLTITTFHTHIGSWCDPDIREQVTQTTLELVEQFPAVTTVDLGGWFKVARMPGEQTTNFHHVGEIISQQFHDFAQKTGRELRCEIEPWTSLIASAWVLITNVIDVVGTWKNGFHFLKLNCGMNDILRPSMYGAQHPIDIMTTNKEYTDYVIIWHCCESGDILTPQPGDPEWISTRTLPTARIGDIVIIWWTGAYCASMAAKHYNSFPECAELLLRSSGQLLCIREAEKVNELWRNERSLR